MKQAINVNRNSKKMKGTNIIKTCDSSSNLSTENGFLEKCQDDDEQRPLDSFLCSIIEANNDLCPTVASRLFPFVSPDDEETECSTLESTESDGIYFPFLRMNLSCPNILAFEGDDHSSFSRHQENYRGEKFENSSQSFAPFPFSSAIQLSYERVNIVLLCFVALSSTEKTEDCFIACPDVSHMDVQLKPLFELPLARFLFLRFRSTFWIGIISNRPTQSARRHEVLNWVRQRRTTTRSSSLATARSSPAGLNFSESSITVSHLVKSPSTSINGLSSFRECHAVLCVFSGEIIAIAPCRRIHHHRLNLESRQECPTSHQSRALFESQLDIEGSVKDWLQILQLPYGQEEVEKTILSDPSMNLSNQCFHPNSLHASIV